MGFISGGPAAVSLQPFNTVARLNLGLAHMREGDTQGARAEFEAVLLIDPGHRKARRYLEDIERGE
jgi:Tfp pilus assembly protein PilF